jgi:L-aspartate oxidase
MTESPKETIFNQPVDVLVLGSGIAGCTAAIKAAERGARVVLVTRGASLSKSNTAWAQGGIVY